MPISYFTRRIHVPFNDVLNHDPISTLIQKNIFPNDWIYVKKITILLLNYADFYLENDDFFQSLKMNVNRYFSLKCK